MGRTLDQMITKTPPARRARIETRYHEVRQEVEGLRELRQIAGKAQADIAAALDIKQPSVSKIENHVDMYLSTLRSYVQAVGGELERVVKLPKRPIYRLHSLCYGMDHPSETPKVDERRHQTRTSSASAAIHPGSRS